ncbi:hypothetical protein [Bythopirellula goksoeyrii]|uniref:Uncharacterized protein n=1 Tax=Bythopirellula goksoeyrii TaxID=1400387 RepID=A0A5B9QM14_9BACT|nr:hypothetical protein [Bythopirellula goksoeyrii]QEG38046.1 hypothetical protein Pr1d_53940 [Bythopirellula goksoeyrii]
MTVFFRASVMLLTLVGLPAAWIYYGPLPTGAQKVVNRFVDVARDALGWQQPIQAKQAWDQAKVAPRFSEAPVRDQGDEAVRFQYDAPKTESTIPASSPISLVSATLPSPEAKVSASDDLASQLEPHFSLLRKLGAADYSLAHWGTEGNLYRFHCSIPFGNEGLMSREFDAIDADPVAAVRQIVGEVTSWQNIKLDAGHSSTQWR